MDWAVHTHTITIVFSAKSDSEENNIKPLGVSAVSELWLEEADFHVMTLSYPVVYMKKTHLIH